MVWVKFVNHVFKVRKVKVVPDELNQISDQRVLHSLSERHRMPKIEIIREFS